MSPATRPPSIVLSQAAKPGSQEGRVAATQAPGRPMVILLVEDDLDDRLFILRAVRNSGIHARVETVLTADEAEDYLLGRDAFADRQRYPSPELILCDLVLPARSGLDLLAWLQRQPALKHIVAIAISGAGDLENLSYLQQLGFKEILDKTTLIFKPSVLAEAIGRLQK